MKLVLCRIIAFLSMSAFVTLMMLAVFLAFIGVIAFISWSLPVLPIAWWMVIRVCVAFGVIIGLCYTFTREGREDARKIADAL